MSDAELALLAALAPRLATDGEGIDRGWGDDAAVVRVDGAPVVVAVDAVVEGVHWHPNVSGPADVGWKALAVNVSDCAAMGAAPLAAVVALQRPPGWDRAHVEALYDGLAEAARRWGVALVGGDVVSSATGALSVTVLGALEGRQAVRRDGASPGDALVCVGALGGPATALAEIEAGTPRTEGLLAAHRRPPAYPEAGRALAEAGAAAMIDCSDGLGADLAHVCRGSQVAAHVEATALPVPEELHAAATALGRDPWELVAEGGEDFALLAAVPADRAEQAVRRAREAQGEVPAAIIGEVRAGPAGAVRLQRPDGTLADIAGRGFEHGRTR